MADRLNSKFNYMYLVNGETPWEKIKVLKGFLIGRKRAAVLEEVARLKLKALKSEIEHLKSIPALPHVILRLEAELIEMESHSETQADAFLLNKQEVIDIEDLLSQLYKIAEPTRIPGYTDDQMFEVNAVNEFTVLLAREIQSEIVANGRPSPAKLKNAMSNPFTFQALKNAGLIPAETTMIGGTNDPLRIAITSVPDSIWNAGITEPKLICDTDNRPKA